jgi:DNA processing protein
MSKYQVNGRDILIYLAIKYQGDWNRMYEAIKNKELVDATNVEETVKSVGSQVCTIIDDAYPTSLKSVYKPPFVLFYHGNLQKLTEKSNLTIISPPNTNQKNLDRVREMVNTLAASLTVVSILDGVGSDDVAYAAAKHESLVAVGFMGINKLTKQYKGFNFNQNLLVSEYPGEVEPTQDQQNWSIRLASSFGHKLLITSMMGNSCEKFAIGSFMYLNKQIMAFTPSIQSKSKQMLKMLEETEAKKVKTPEEILTLMSSNTESHSNGAAA